MCNAFCGIIRTKVHISSTHTKAGHSRQVCHTDTQIKEMSQLQGSLGRQASDNSKLWVQ